MHTNDYNTLPSPTTGADVRAWVGCPCCYHDGRLSGRWMDAEEADNIPSDWSCPACGSQETYVYNIFDATGLLPLEDMSPSEFARLARAAVASTSDTA